MKIGFLMIQQAFNGDRVWPSFIMFGRDGYGTLIVHEKLIGAQNYRSWKKYVEIALLTKQKLGFIRGTVPRSPDDASLEEQWDTCNNLVIKTRFALGNGSHKYKLNKEAYDTMQFGKSMSEYYTSMKCIWEELDSMNELPSIVNITPKIQIFLKVLNTQKEEQRLFQLLNGLYDHFSTQRSQLLLNLPLTSVETICALLQQEESQRRVFGSGQLGVESTDFYSKEKVGYSSWYHKYKQNQKAKGEMKSGNAPVKRHAALVKNGGHVVFTSKQFEQLLKSLPHFNQNGASDHMSHDNNVMDNVHVLKNKQDLKTRMVLGLGKKKVGLYHLLNLYLKQIHA
nr:peptidase family M48 family protein [Tanacetum cinerariifolium]